MATSGMASSQLHYPQWYRAFLALKALKRLFGVFCVLQPSMWHAGREMVSPMCYIVDVYGDVSIVYCQRNEPSWNLWQMANALQYQSMEVKLLHFVWLRQVFYSLVTYWNVFTSSTAQGGGGSFKNRKPIGEVGCCESRMAERITDRWLSSPLFLSFFSLFLLCFSLFLWLSTYLPTYWSIYLSSYWAI